MVSEAIDLLKSQSGMAAGGAAASPVETFDLVILGGTGDLALRKLLPALFHRSMDGQLANTCRIIGASRTELSTEQYRERVRAAIEEHVPALNRSAAALDQFLSLVSYSRVDAGGESGWRELSGLLTRSRNSIRVFYLAISPQLYAPVCERLRTHGLSAAGARVVLEKPIGSDLASAAAINDAVGAAFDERQVFRIDHYLGKETVQNLTALRFGNVLFEPLWNSAHVDHVQITVAERIGVEWRGGYYDTAGALRDMVQNHLLQLLCLVAMEPPASMHADAIRDEKLKVLRSLKPIDQRNAHLVTVRGQYRAGASEARSVPGYLEEVGRPQSAADTFVALKAEVANWRWSGVPFYLRTGKRLAERVSEIMVNFRAIPHSIFETPADAATANRLVIRLQPDEGVKLWLMVKDPGPGGMRLRRVPLDMSFAEAFGGRRHPDAYERLLMDVVRGNPTLFMRRDEVEAAWRWIDPIVAAWTQSHESPKPYTAGTWGPSAAIALIEREGRTWHEEAP